MARGQYTVAKALRDSQRRLILARLVVHASAGRYAPQPHSTVRTNRVRGHSGNLTRARVTRTGVRPKPRSSRLARDCRRKHRSASSEYLPYTCPVPLSRSPSRLQTAKRDSAWGAHLAASG